MDKFHHSEFPKTCSELFQQISSVHSYETTFVSMENYFIQHVSCKAGKKSIFYRDLSYKKSES